MRDIIFRGYNKADHQWYYGNFRISRLNNGWIYAITDERNFHNYHYVEEDSVGQYTGICDVMGYRIYEGDILCSVNNSQFKYIVKWDRGCWMIFNTTYDSGELFVASMGRNMKIIGNAFEKRLYKKHLKERATTTLNSNCSKTKNFER